MSDLTADGLQGTEAGQSQDQGSSGPAAQTAQYITQETLDERLQKREQNISRLVQSQTDRTVGGLKKSVEKKLKEFEQIASEAGMPDNLIEAEKARIWSEAIGEFQDRGNPAPVAQQDEIAQVNQWIYEIADQLGVAPLYPKDPEFAQVDYNDPNPANFKAQYESAIRAKATRRQGQAAAAQPPAQPTNPTAPGARAPTLTQGPPSGNPTLEQLTQRLRALQTKAGSRTNADYAEMKDLEAKIVAQLPRR